MIHFLKIHRYVGKYIYNKFKCSNLVDFVYFTHFSKIKQ